MSSDTPQLTGPDLARGVPLSQLPDGGMLAGHANGEAVLLARRGDELFAVGAQCTHYSGPLAEGVMVGDTVRCPWHHACFSLRTGEALRAPALNPLPRWRVERRGELVVVAEKLPAAAADGATPPSATFPGPAPLRASGAPERVVIVGAGAAGAAAAEMLRRCGYAGSLTMVGAEDETPYDRPNLSKDYLAGNAPEEWIPLRGRDFYAGHEITLALGARAAALDARNRRLTLEDGRELPFDRLLLATGADPVRLPLPGSERPHVRYLRSLADSRALIARAKESARAVVLGASFIGLEVAASLRARGIEVHVVGPEARPLERVLGPQLGALVRSLHEEKGVVFHLGQTATAVGERDVTLADGTRLAADLVVIGVGVRPSVALAEGAGLALDRGVQVSETLETSAPGIYAAGDIARWPDERTGERIRVEHWVVAERQGQCAARNILGAAERYDSVPFFWSSHYDVTVAYTGHAERWDAIDVDGDPSSRDCAVRYQLAGRTLAIATVGRDRENLEAEVGMEK
ncbi:MAG TPA: FAD-dependent oxidoreductase [Gemmatimonadaceae bacterium]|nr:FAD-dependent oxidoreductase [Gemmatimonadaceae bacterium]